MCASLSSKGLGLARGSQSLIWPPSETLRSAGGRNASPDREPPQRSLGMTESDCANGVISCALLLSVCLVHVHSRPVSPALCCTEILAA